MVDSEQEMMNILIVVAQKDFQDYEYQAPRNIFENNGYKVQVASETKGRAKGKFGLKVNVDLALSEVNVSDFNAVVFVGGPGAVKYQNNRTINKILETAVNEGKVIGAICIAPTILAHAGVLSNRAATVWNEDGQQNKILEQNGCKYLTDDLVVDDKIITANGPKAAEKFGEKIVQVLQK